MIFRKTTFWAHRVLESIKSVHFEYRSSLKIEEKSILVDFIQCLSTWASKIYDDKNRVLSDEMIQTVL